MSCSAWNKQLGLAIAALTLAAHAQTAMQAIPGVVAAGTPVELIKEGFTGTEGPVALPDGSLIFAETRANRITRIAADGSTSTFLDNSNGSNGLGFTTNGDLYAVQVQQPQNMAFAGADKKTLYVVSPGAAYKIALLAGGYGGRAK